MRGRTTLETRNSNSESWHGEETYYYFLIGPLFTKLRPRDCGTRPAIQSRRRSQYLLCFRVTFAAITCHFSSFTQFFLLITKLFVISAFRVFVAFSCLTITRNCVIYWVARQIRSEIKEKFIDDVFIFVELIFYRISSSGTLLCLL